MAEWLAPGKKMGLIGESMFAHQLILTAKQMGFQVNVYSNHVNEAMKQSADSMITGSYSDRDALSEIAFATDFLVYETEELPSNLVEGLQKTVAVPQGEEMLSIVQDRVLQKAYLEANSVNIAPFATIVSLADVQEAVQGIGYPCILKTNRTDKQHNEHVVLYSEKDLDTVPPLLKKGVCVLEALIPFERQLQVSVIRNHEGDQILYPVSEMVYREDNLYQVITPARIDLETEKEINRIARLISVQLDVIGSLSLEFLMTSAGALYVTDLVFGPHLAGSWTLNGSNLSHFEAHLRGIANWPLPEPILYSPSVIVPFHKHHLEKVDRQIPIKPNWQFHYYPYHSQAIREKEVGYITIFSEDLDTTLDKLADIELWEGRKKHD